MVTDQQVVLLRQKLMEGKSQQGAAAASGMSVRTVRTWQRGRLPSEKKGKRRWRTRPDPFAGVWAEEVEPLLRSDVEGALKATTILEWLDERHPGRFSLSQLRTLQRRLRDWRALSGPDREVFFEQEHPPGREAQVDFTHCGELGVTVCGEPFGHLLFHFVLSHSGWRYVDIAYGETFAALVKGMQGALWELGGVPEVLTRIHRRYDVAAAEWVMRGKGRRWSGHDSGIWGRCLSSAAAGRPCNRLGTLGRARWRGEDAARGARGPDWREFAGTFGWADGGSVADGRRQAGSGIARSRARARLNWVSQGQRCGRCRVRRRAERVSRPAREKKPSPKGLGGRDLLAQTDPRRPAGQVVGHHLYRQPSAVGGEAAGRHVVQTDAVLEVLEWRSRSRRGGGGRPPVPGSLRPGR